MQALIELFGIKGFIPHGYCLSWSPILLWLHVVSDLLITLSYYSIPLMLIYFIRRRKDFPHQALATMFAGFIVACGSTHLLSAITIWIPLYWLDGLVKGFTAIISVVTAVWMLRIIPLLLHLSAVTQLQIEVDQRKAAEQELRIANAELQKNNAHTRLLLDSALDGIVSMDRNGKVIGWNAQAEHIFAYTGEQALGRDLAELIIPPAYREKHRQGLSRFTGTGLSNILGTRLEVIGLRAGTIEFPMELSVDMLRHENEYFFSAYVRDISERKQAEAAQQEALDKLYKIACQLPGVVFQFRLRADGGYCLPYASAVLRDIYRIDPEDVLDDASALFAVVHPDDLAQHLASIQASARDLSPWRNEYRLKFADGGECWLFGNALPQREADGSVLWHGFVTDITESKRVETELRDSEQKFRQLLQQIPLPLCIVNLTGATTFINNRFEQLFGYQLSEIPTLDHWWQKAYPDVDYRSWVMAHWGAAVERALNEGVDIEPFEYNVSCKDGTVRIIAFSGLCFTDSFMAVGIDVTERKQIENALRESEFRWKFAIEGSGDGLWDWDVANSTVFFSKRWKEMLGFAENEIDNSLEEWAERIHPDDKADVLAVVQDYFDGKIPVYLTEHRVSCKDGGYKWILDRGIVVSRDADGNPLRMIGTHTDITEHKQMEQKLRDSDAFNVSILNSLSSHITVLDAQGNIVAVNDAWRRFAKDNGLPESANNMLGFNYLDACKNPLNQPYGDEADAARTGIMAVLTAERESFHLEYPCHSPTQPRWFQMNVSPLQDSHRGVVVSHENITVRKLMEDELKAGEAKFRSIIEMSPVPMALNDGQLNITYLNPAFVQTFGYSIDDIPTLADWWPKAYPDQDYRQWVIDAWQAAFERVEREHRPFLPLEIEICSKDGSVLTVLASAAIIADSFKDEHLVVLYDITERKQAERAKNQSEAQLRAFYELDLVGLTITSPEKGWIRINDSLCKMLEYPEQALHQMTWAELTHPDDLAADVEQFNRLLANEINGYALEKRFVSRTGKVIPTQLVVRSVRKANGELDYVVAMVEDISEYKQAEAELKRSNTELEQFAYAVSHDMRQPLRMVNSYLSLIENALAGQMNEETQQFLDFAMDGAKRMDAMILSLLDYSRVGRKSEAKTKISSKLSLDEALAFLNPELIVGGEIKVTGEWPEVFASRDELTRLLQNLIGNALKYHEENQAPQVHIHGMTKADRLRVEVRDQGIGIEPSQIDRLFKVFSRLQARSRFDGTGVGLALCRKIVEHHGGIIGVESAGEGQGSLFWFELPIINAAAPE